MKAALARRRLRDDRPDRGDRAGRQEALRAARRDRHGREHPAHQRVDHEQEDRRGHRRARARRQDRQRRVHEDRADARRLAESLVSIGNAAGVRTEALITAMDAPLGRAVGNALEVDRVHRDAEGRRPGRSRSRCRVELAARMLVLGGVAADRGRRASGGSRGAIASGAGLERFRQIIERRAAIRASSTTTSGCRACADRHVVTAPRDGLRGASRRRAGRPGVGRARRRPRPRRRPGRSGGRHHGAAPSRATAVRAGRSDARAALPRQRGTARARRLRSRRRAPSPLATQRARRRGRSSARRGVR